MGTTLPIYHSDDKRVTIASVAGELRRLAVARDRIVFTIAENTGNISIVELRGHKMIGYVSIEVKDLTAIIQDELLRRRPCGR